MRIFIAYIILIFNCFCSSSKNTLQDYNRPVFFSKEIELIKEGVDSLSKISTTHSILLYKNDSLIFESYLNDHPPKSPGNLKSASKSILSSLIGIAVQNNFISDINQTVYEFMPEYFIDSTKDWKKEIKIKDLLTMASGLETTSGLNYNDWISSSNWISYALNEKQVSKSGELFHYSTGDTHLLSAILTKATGMSSLEFAHKYLFDKMGIRISYWEQDPQGYYLGGNNLFLSPHELGAFGLLFMNNGFYNNQQIVPEKWVVESTQKKIDVPNKSPDSAKLRVEGYGYLWWLLSFGDYKAICALGFGGQMLIMIKELDMIIVSTSDWETPNGKEQQKIFEIINDKIKPAFNSQN